LCRGQVQLKQQHPPIFTKTQFCIATGACICTHFARLGFWQQLEEDMPRWMIDDQGNLHTAGPRALAQILGIPTQGPGNPETRTRTLEDLAIINVGVIAIETTNGALSVRLRPTLMSSRAVGALAYFLLDHANQPVTISWYNTTWNIEYAANAVTAMAFISSVLELQGHWLSASEHDRIQYRPSPRAERKWHEVSALVSPLTSGQPAYETFSAILDRPFAGRWSIFEFNPRTGTAVVACRGNGYPMLHPIFSPSNKGHDLEMLADRRYRDWILECLKNVADTDRPRFEDVDALVDWPRFGTLRTRYWRLMVPLTSSSGVNRILSASCSDSGIDLRPKNIEKARKMDECIVA
jgi:hypothetical protein